MQGQLFAVRSEATGVLLVMCDDCGSQWLSPEQSQSYENALKEEIKDLRPAMIEEIRAAGWISGTWRN